MELECFPFGQSFTIDGKAVYVPADDLTDPAPANQLNSAEDVVSTP